MRALLLLSLTMVALAARFASAQAPSDPAEDLFVRKCSSCHTVGKGPRVGPDLAGVHERRDAAWLARLVETPSRMLDTDPDARRLLAEWNGVRMPDLGLTPGDVQALLAMLVRCTSEPCDLQGKLRPVAEATAEDAARGRRLFLGLEPQQAGGAPCVSCHTVQGSGSVVPGGTLAKDLTNAFGRLGDQGLDAALKNPAFPVMNQVFADHPLEAAEVFALRAFLNEANRAEPEPEDQWSPLLAAVLGTLVALAALQAGWSRRLRGVRTALTRRARKEGLA